VLGFATGEEACSIAILLREHMATLNNPPQAQIFATISTHGRSTNEELQSVNSELSHRVSELERTNCDLKNLLVATQIAAVFLDHDLRVRNFPRVAAEIFHLLAIDVDRPIDHAVSRVDYPELLNDLHSVLKTPVPVEREVVDRVRDRHFAVRVLPYRNTDNYISGRW